MANPQKGEIEFELGGKAYTYLLGTYGLAKLEERCGKPWPAIFGEATKDGWGWRIALACFHCGLLLHHESMTEREASVLLDELTVPEFMKRLGEVWKLQFGVGGDEPVRPMIAAASNGSGTASSVAG